MKQIAEYTKQQLRSGKELLRRSTTQPGTPLPDVWISSLFSKIKAIFGNKWIDRFHTEADIALAREEWAKGLRGMTAEQISAALDICRTEMTWPPDSPGQFRSLGIVKLAPCHRIVARKLPRPQGDPEAARLELKRMRNIIHR